LDDALPLALAEPEPLLGLAKDDEDADEEEAEAEDKDALLLAGPKLAGGLELPCARTPNPSAVEGPGVPRLAAKLR